MKGLKFEVFEVSSYEFFQRIKVFINCVTRLYHIKLNSLENKTTFSTTNGVKFTFEKFLGHHVRKKAFLIVAYRK